MNKDDEDLGDFIRKNTKLWNYIAILFALLCPEETRILMTLPEHLRIFGNLFSAGYWNLEPADNFEHNVGE